MNHKPRITVEKASSIFVQALVQSVDQEFTHVADVLRKAETDMFAEKSQAPSRIPEMGDKEKVEFATAVFSLELLGLPNLFDRDVAGRIRNASIRHFSARAKMQEHDLLTKVAAYEERYNKFTEAGLDPMHIADSDGFLALLCVNLGIRMEHVELAGKHFEVPGVSIGTTLNAILSAWVGGWKELQSKFQVVWGIPKTRTCGI